jgi:hypothetical protein
MSGAIEKPKDPATREQGLMELGPMVERHRPSSSEIFKTDKRANRS